MRLKLKLKRQFNVYLMPVKPFFEILQYSITGNLQACFESDGEYFEHFSSNFCLVNNNKLTAIKFERSNENVRWQV